MKVDPIDTNELTIEEAAVLSASLRRVGSGTPVDAGAARAQLAKLGSPPVRKIRRLRGSVAFAGMIAALVGALIATGATGVVGSLGDSFTSNANFSGLVERDGTLRLLPTWVPEGYELTDYFSQTGSDWAKLIAQSDGGSEAGVFVVAENKQEGSIVALKPFRSVGDLSSPMNSHDTPTKEGSKQLLESLVYWADGWKLAHERREAQFLLQIAVPLTTTLSPTAIPSLLSGLKVQDGKVIAGKSGGFELLWNERVPAPEGVSTLSYHSLRAGEVRTDRFGVVIIVGNKRYRRFMELARRVFPELPSSQSSLVTRILGHLEVEVVSYGDPTRWQNPKSKGPDLKRIANSVEPVSGREMQVKLSGIAGRGPDFLFSHEIHLPKIGMILGESYPSGFRRCVRLRTVASVDGGVPVKPVCRAVTPGGAFSYHGLDATDDVLAVREKAGTTVFVAGADVLTDRIDISVLSEPSRLSSELNEAKPSTRLLRAPAAANSEGKFIDARLPVLAVSTQLRFVGGFTTVSSGDEKSAWQQDYEVTNDGLRSITKRIELTKGLASKTG